MKPLLVAVILFIPLTACTASNSFETDDSGNCYRTREQSFIIWTYNTERVLALDTNCGDA